MNVRDVRKARGMGQQALADALGVDRRQVSRWENGQVPYREMRAAIARALDVSPHAIDWHGPRGIEA